MPKPINRTIGNCVCSTIGCGVLSAVRRMKGGSGRLYLVCSECGTIRPTGQRFQSYILNNAELFGPEGGPEPVPVDIGSVPEPENTEMPMITEPAPENGPSFWTDGTNEFEAFING